MGNKQRSRTLRTNSIWNVPAGFEEMEDKGCFIISFTQHKTIFLTPFLGVFFVIFSKSVATYEH